SHVVAGGEPEQRSRFPCRIAQTAEKLVTGSAALRVNRWTDQYERPHPAREAHGELGDDLAAHRVRHERGALEPGCVQPPGERGCEVRDAKWARRPLAAPVPGEVRREHGNEGCERSGKWQ